MKGKRWKRAIAAVLAVVLSVPVLPGTKVETEAAVVTTVPEPVYQYDFDGTLEATIGEKTAVKYVGGEDKMSEYVGNTEFGSDRNGTENGAVYLNNSYGLDLNIGSLSGDYTFSFWVSAKEQVKLHGPVFMVGDFDNYVSLSGKGSNDEIKIWTHGDGYGWSEVLNPITSGLNQWHHYIMTIDTDTGFMRFYTDGKFINEINVSRTAFTNSDSDVYLGVNYWDDMFCGYFDEVKVFDEVLTAAQIEVLYGAEFAIDAPEIATVGDVISVEAVATNENYTIDWSVSDSDLAEIDTLGNVTCKADGTVSVIGILKDGENVIGKLTDSITVYADTTANEYPNNIAMFTFDQSDDGFKGGNAVAISSTGSTEDLMSTIDGKQGIQIGTKNAEFLKVTDAEGKPLLNGYDDVKISFEYKDLSGGTDWVLFAAPNDASPTYPKEHYLGIIGNSNIQVERYDNEDGRPGVPSATLENGTWSKIDIVLTEGNTAIYVNGNLAIQMNSDYSLAEILENSENGILWIGKATWGQGEYSSFYMDNFSISVKTNYAGLDEVLKSYLSLDPIQYEESSWESLEEKYTEVYSVRNTEGVTQKEVDKAANELKTAINELVPKITIDKTELYILIDEAEQKVETDYKPTGWTAFASALSQAREVGQSGAVTQDEVNAAILTLRTAMDALVQRADKTNLVAAIDDAEKKNETLYTIASWKEFGEALKTARDLNADGDASEEDITSAITALEVASSKLVSKELKLIASYDLTKTDAVNGSTLVDQSGFDNNATLVNFDSSIDTANGLAFDGQNDYVGLPASLDLVNTEEFAVEATFKANDKEFGWLWSIGTGNESNYVFLVPRSPDNNESVLSGAKDSQTEYTFNNRNAGRLGDAEEHTIRVEFENGDMKIYIDGDISAHSLETGLQMENLLADAETNEGFIGYLGKSLYPNDPYFNGTLTKFEIYAKVAEPNKKELTNTIDTVLEEDNYTEESWNAYSNALEMAASVLEDTSTTQYIVDEATRTLQKTINELELKGYTYYEAENVNTTTGNPQPKKVDIASGETVYTYMGQNPVNSTYHGTITFENLLVKKAGSYNLRVYYMGHYEESRSYDLQIKVNDSEPVLCKLDNVLGDAVYVYEIAVDLIEGENSILFSGTAEATDWTVNIDRIAIEEYLDTTALQTAIETAQSLEGEDYTKGSYEVVTQKLDAAEAILKAPYKTQEEIDEAAEAFNTAINGLVLISGVKEKMALIYSFIGKHDSAEFEAGKWSTLISSIKDADFMLSNPNVDQSAVDNTLNLLAEHLEQMATYTVTVKGTGTVEDRLADPIEKGAELDFGAMDMATLRADAQDQDAIPFAYWAQLDSEEKILSVLSYAPVYTFYVTEDINVMPVYAEPEDVITEDSSDEDIKKYLEDKMFINSETTYDEGLQRLMITARRGLPMGCVIEEHGILVTKNADYSTEPSTFVIGESGEVPIGVVKKGIAGGEINGMDSLKVALGDNQTCYTRGYVKYTYTIGERTVSGTFYGDIVSGTNTLTI